MLWPTKQQVQNGTDGQGLGRWASQHRGHSQPGAGLLPSAEGGSGGMLHLEQQPQRWLLAAPLMQQAPSSKALGAAHSQQAVSATHGNHLDLGPCVSRQGPQSQPIPPGGAIN